jgi:hypothetical protein
MVSVCEVQPNEGLPSMVEQHLRLDRHVPREALLVDLAVIADPSGDPSVVHTGSKEFEDLVGAACQRQERYQSDAEVVRRFGGVEALVQLVIPGGREVGLVLRRRHAIILSRDASTQRPGSGVSRRPTGGTAVP